MTEQVLRANSKLRQTLGPGGVAFLEHAAGAVQRILPHVELSGWKEGDWDQPGATWTSSKRTEVRMTFVLRNAGSLRSIVRRRRLPIPNGIAGGSLDLREHDICRRIAIRVSEVLVADAAIQSRASLDAIKHAFDEYIVAEHIQAHHGLQMSLGTIFEAIHKLYEQGYENKALAFGCVLDPAILGVNSAARFPAQFLESKKYKALSDGFRTAYHISTDGGIVDFLALNTAGHRPLTERHYYPEWAEPIARVSRSGKCGMALSRQGDLLVFDEGTLRFSYRYGKWQYWNHAHLVRLLQDRAQTQGVPSMELGKVILSIYRAVMDVSFRRSGGLFVLLHDRNNLHDMVRPGDAIGDANRQATDRDFDNVLQKQAFVQSLRRPVIVELASLDGAMVLANSGLILAYGAVLQPKRVGRLRGTEGSRTKVAIGASHYGLAIKVSSDGDITVYHEGKEFIRV